MKTMKRKQSVYEWLNKDPDIKNWLIDTTFPNADDKFALIVALSNLTEEDLRKIKQRWNSYSHRSKRRSISCDITPEAFSTLKKIQGKRSLTETLEEIIALNYEAKKYYKNFFEEKIKSRRPKKDPGISQRLHHSSNTLENATTHRSELSKLNGRIEEQEGQIAKLKLIAITLTEKLLNEGISLDSSITKHLSDILEPSSPRTHDIPSNKNQIE
ncbi:TPA: hypothetical protein L4623_004927 [Pseudomonas aeruginosa]|uniref:hypothetical protein n=1 Tax=Pseudomonas aeruginosa TaxID=287 RepID=UPI000F543366|nr:hypothetical protein [Pseudomonas aeruginosa]EIU5250295.1 hypothetical protein [Pseudomonas aeruginosa]MBG6347765.1 hypothetical protein [Pseudomonas aeruginosa]MBG6545790.1 hypothetical protein [Pseudomonas aeruginosa]MBH3501493.1 hypothetical protein [Pseudomonas aeruginosa]MBH4419479.1 hypothetical protein [Pseudomonas aeruginosa]